MIRSSRFLLGVLFLAAISSIRAFAAPADSPKPLLVYFIDVEGGQATLFVTPSRESLLIDTGWDGHDGRDADRIIAAAKDAGLSKIDYVLITHYHEDHVGGVPQLAAKFPIGGFIDHGHNHETDDAGAVARVKAYEDLLATGKYKHIVVKPGDVLPFKGATFTVVAGDGKVIEKPLPGAGQPNSNCQDVKLPPADHSENEFSLGFEMNFGQFRLVDLGDLPWVKETELMCPVNKIGKIDFLVATHHGLFFSNSIALVRGVAPRVAVMENGAKKGGSPAAWDIIHSSPGLVNLWQLHYSEEGGDAHNSPAEFLANLAGADGGQYLKLTAWPDASFKMFNSRTGQTRSYAPQM